ncbi:MULTISPECIES: hypothetical protein [unclassified Lysobacter]|uniref:hypothetical protein n=1 Tax=unclassified Lysobacter TaxID=2635362 RepID=UPI001BEA9984|nr:MULTISPECIES: hypothetical protein [unclassified Lysobacter]MBT2746649.1 hypothetical protein [Lysobacter sp. ISL-42]MBT2753356.1 hypothetical protein [Lysobacter sp. ISL-50]MBT2775466.1 hypothetical protein [Lysobacter sp. ISL-54]MBT2782998.1 hypothetical protein [Lysobacter sp. ISL-52]
MHESARAKDRTIASIDAGLDAFPRIGANALSRRMPIANVAAVAGETGGDAIRTWIGWRGRRCEKYS